MKLGDVSFAQIHGEERHRNFFLNAFVEEHLSLLRERQLLALRSADDLTRRGPANGAGGLWPLVNDSDGERLVRVKCGNRSIRRKFCELASCSGVNVRDP